MPSSYNNFLRDEIEKRWPLLYKRRKNGNWVCVFPSGEVSSFRISKYADLDGNASILRLKDGVNLHSPPKGKSYYVAKDVAQFRFKFSFSSDETEAVIPWALDNYLSVCDLPEWLNKSPNVSAERIGKPLDFYFWTQLAMEQYDSKYRNKDA